MGTEGYPVVDLIKRATILAKRNIVGRYHPGR
jgi:hypothetical protein